MMLPFCIYIFIAMSSTGHTYNHYTPIKHYQHHLYLYFFVNVLFLHVLTSLHALGNMPNIDSIAPDLRVTLSSNL